MEVSYYSTQVMCRHLAFLTLKVIHTGAQTAVLRRSHQESSAHTQRGEGGLHPGLRCSPLSFLSLCRVRGTGRQMLPGLSWGQHGEKREMNKSGFW